MVDYKETLKQSEELAKKYSHEYITTDHLFFTLIQYPTIIEVMDSACSVSIRPVTTDSIMAQFSELFEDTTDFGKALNIEPKRTEHVEILVSKFNQYDVVQQLISSEHPTDISEYEFFAEVLNFRDTHAEFILQSNGIDIESMFIILEEKSKDRSMFQGDPKNENPLETYTVNLTERARDGKLGTMIGRTNELQALTQILARKNKCNAVLTGEAGVGKTQIVEGLAQNIVDGKSHKSLTDVEIFSVDITAMLAGAKYRGEFEARLKAVMDAVSDDPTKILFIDEMHSMMGTGSSKDGTMDMANIMKPKLSRGEIRVIGSTTSDEFDKHIAKDKAMSRRFMKVDVIEPSISECKKILHGIAPQYSEFHGVKYDNDALSIAVELSSRFIQNKVLPDKAIDVMDAAGARNKVSKSPQKTITKRLIEDEVSRISGIPVDMMVNDQDAEPVDLFKVMKTQVFGQDKALEVLADSIEIAQAGLSRENSTMGNFIFTGPSGTGKTQSAKELAKGMGVELVRINMNDYMEKHAVSTLIGAPAGYVGYEEGTHGVLIDKLEKHPNCVLLLDEIEKAHPDVLNVFLQAFDEGFITSRKDKVVSLQNVVVILTTNLGSSDANKRNIGFGKQKDGMDKAIEQSLTPELRNRITEIVKFSQLNEKCMAMVVAKFVKEINVAASKSNVKLTLDKSAIKFIVAQAIPLNLGGRPVKRLLTKHVERILAKEMLLGSLRDGGKVTFTEQDGTLVIK